MKVLLLPEILGELEELGLPEETLKNFTRWLAVNASSTIIVIDTTVHHLQVVGGGGSGPE